MSKDFSDLAQLALKLQASSDPDVAALAQGMLQMEAVYGELRHAYIRLNAEVIMRRNSKLFEKLKEAEDAEKEGE